MRMIALYASVFARDQSNIYDLGCSLGEVSRLIAEQTRQLECAIIAVDNSPSMIRKCQQFGDSGNIEWRCDDIQNIEIGNASMVVLNLTLLFIEGELSRAIFTISVVHWAKCLD